MGDTVDASVITSPLKSKQSSSLVEQPHHEKNPGADGDGDASDRVQITGNQLSIILCK